VIFFLPGRHREVRPVLSIGPLGGSSGSVSFSLCFFRSSLFTFFPPCPALIFFFDFENIPTLRSVFDPLPPESCPLSRFLRGSLFSSPASPQFLPISFFPRLLFFLYKDSFDFQKKLFLSYRSRPDAFIGVFISFFDLPSSVKPFNFLLGFLCWIPASLEVQAVSALLFPFFSGLGLTSD